MMYNYMLGLLFFSTMIFTNYEPENYVEYDQKNYQYIQEEDLLQEELRDLFIYLPFQPLLQGIIEGNHPYEDIFIDGNGDWLLIKSPANYAWLSGEYLDESSLHKALSCMQDYKNLILICDESIQDFFIKHGFVVQPRIELTMEYLFETLPEEKELPEGCTVQLCDKNLFKQSPWFASLSLAAGGSHKFLENCFGYALVDEHGNWLAQAYAAFIGGDECEIGIITHPDHRGKGYIFYPLYAVMQECLHQDLVPVWSCNSENFASLKTALKFGFKINRHYAFLKRFKKNV